MRKTNLVDLMQRYITGTLTELEKKKLEVWLDVKKTEQGADFVLSPEDEERLFRAITANINNIEEIQNFRPRRRVKKPFSNRWLQAAATLLLVAMSFYTIWFFGARSTAAVETISSFGTEKAILDDGSIVWLQKSSLLTYGNSEHAREATFTGEALFEVAKDPGKPFTISCGDFKVMVVGTSFNLKSSADTFELVVLRGKVKVSSTKYPDRMVVGANERVVYNAGAGIVKTSIDSDEITIVIPDEYDMEFRNTAMRDVLAKVEAKFDVKINVENPAVKECRITADFTDNSLQGTMEMLADFLDIGFTITNDSVNISGKGCI